MNLPVLRIAPSSKLPDSDQYVNRFEIKSASSNRIYIVSQSRTKRHWLCSCPGWRVHRKCRHLAALALPAYERAHEVIVNG